MPITLKSGFGGKVNVVDNSQTPAVKNAIANVGEWSLEISNDIQKAEIMGQKSVQKQYGLQDWKGKMSVFYDPNDANGQEKIRDAILNQTPLDCEFWLDDTHYYAGTILISKLSPGAKANDLVSYDIEFEGSGDYTYN